MMYHQVKVKLSFFRSAICVGLLGFLPLSAEAQTVIGGNTPDPSAMLDIQSTSKGVLLPRVPNNSSVPSPATGLVIFNEGNKCLEINLGTPGSPNWQSIKCEAQCGAYVAPGVWKRFMCHNLGAANLSADPFTPSWEINGDYWRWGTDSKAVSGPSDVNTPNDAAVSGWSSLAFGADGDWVDASPTSPTTNKGPKDPCPAGFRVPSKTQWEGVINNTLNPQSNIGGSPWPSGATIYTTGIKFGSALFLPATGFRSNGTGTLFDRGEVGDYWSSTEAPSAFAWYMDIRNGVTSMGSTNRTNGFSVRCIAE